MRVTHLFRRFRLEDGGVMRAIIDLSVHLARAGVEVRVLTADATDFPREEIGQDTPLRIVEDPAFDIGHTRALPGGTLPAVVRDAIREAGVLHLHGMWDTGDLAAAAAARRLGVPYVISPHGMLDDWSMAQSALKKRVFLRLAGSRMLRGAAVMHCTAEAELAQASRWFPGTPGVAVPLVFDTEPFEHLPGPAEAERAFPAALGGDRPRVLFLSRLHYKKGPDVFLRAVALLRDRGVETAAVLAGSGDEAYTAELRALAREAGLEDTAHFVGLVSGSLKLSLYEACDVLLLPTSQENFGFVFPESLACGTPVVTTPGVDTHAELRASGGAVISPRTPDALADAVQRLLEDRAASREMGARGRAWVLDDLAPHRTVMRYTEMYQRAASRDGSGTGSGTGSGPGNAGADAVPGSTPSSA